MIYWAEEMLIKDAIFHLSSKKKVINSKSIKEVAVDVTEIKRP